MKQKVLKFLQNLPSTPEAQFNEAFGLYRNCPEHSFSQVRYLNASGYSKVSLENLLYDLQKINNISDAQVRDTAVPASVAKINLIPAVPVFSKGAKGNKERQAFVKLHKLTSVSKKNVDLDAAIKIWHETQSKLSEENKEDIDVDFSDVTEGEVVQETTAKEVFENAPEEVKEYMAIHDEFPFLDEDDCPEELKILVADKRKHFRKYMNARKHLLVVVDSSEENDKAPTPMSNEEMYELAKAAVDNFEINQAIFSELDHYNKEGKILGEHPIFKSRLLKEKIDNMTMAKAAKRASNLDNYIRRDQNALAVLKVAEEKDENAIKKMKLKIELWKMELGLVNAKLGAGAE